MLDENGKYKQLFAELEEYEKDGVPIIMDGFPASPQQIVNAHMLREEGSYMRDYILNPNGNIEKLNFTALKDEKANRFPSRKAK